MRGNLPPLWWHEYAKVLYSIPSQPPPTWLMLTPIQLFNSTKCKKLHWSVIIWKDPRSWWIGRWALWLLSLLAHIFNRATREGFPVSSTEHTIEPIFKGGDPMILSNYRTFMNGHYLARLYGSIVESELSMWPEWNGCHSVGKAGFPKKFTTLDDILNSLLERPLVTMLSRQLQRKSTMPHDIIRVEFTLPPMLV